ncbi:MAG: hypothetical protein UT30_C0003G0040 [Candidatus Uhrbacteria bacterium GW2011_GWF2_39_13]|uniref:Uncharacterized protein n=1 Tax=Candidatus Uhrbacteria bacterium GW2011_GWF2_39_13 TaxID=1618995 RepID=A0A0G0MWN7_9BACT|nr:MAG: hypothetical protein UT30_C0003G0040 [Candidatus Uhrbacteria bacterium GW2011_GWF2_39_13]HAU66244.1 hypothetical protein [Candidatus Uhrbacteria bacterium]
MGIPTRVAPSAPKTTSTPVRQAVLPPTRGMVEHASATLSELLGQDKTWTKSIVEFSEKSVMTAWALIDYTVFMVRCYVAEMKLQGQIREADAKFNAFNRAMNEAEAADLEAMRKAHSMDGKANAKAKTEAIRAANTRVLRGIPEGTVVVLNRAERRLVIETLASAFAVPEGTPLEKELGGVVIGRQGAYQRFALNLIRTFLGNETYDSEFKAQLAAARSSSVETDEQVAVAC